MSRKKISFKQIYKGLFMLLQKLHSLQISKIIVHIYLIVTGLSDNFIHKSMRYELIARLERQFV